MWIPKFLSGLKPPLKRFRHRTRARYIKRFYSFTPQDFSEKLSALGVERGDVVCVQSSFDQFLGFQGDVGHAIRCLQDAVGLEGGLLMPTQPFGGRAIDWVREHPVTDLARHISVMGMMTEILRRTPGAVRSIHPTHSVAVWGEKGLALARNDWEARTPCGRNTAYYRLLESDGKILMLGTGVQPMVFYHTVEEIIEPLMPLSPFTAEEYTLKTKDIKGNLYTSHMRLFEPVLSRNRRLSLLVPEMKSRRFWRESKVGRLEMLLFNTSEVLEACRSMAKKGQFCYLPEPTR
jgi:aminoglycoside 3-N-acetyltransferase